MPDLSPSEFTLLRICFDARLREIWNMKKLTRQDRQNEMLKVRLLAGKLGVMEL